ncbi:MAG: tetratricopeptide repeat protein [Ignavibacteriae bacterium]|nr:tetratricopeptide repeat protein [Ignavibacteriota bacterium]
MKTKKNKQAVPQMPKKKKRNYLNYLLIFLALVVIGFGAWFLFFNKDGRDTFADKLLSTGINDRITISYPHNNSIFPPDIASPTFRWDDPGDIDNWLVMLESEGKIKFISKYLDERKWKPDSSEWEEIKEFGYGRNITVNIIGVNKNETGRIYNGGRINISISKDSVAAPVFFRAVPLPFGFAFDNLPTISWRMASISHYSQPKIMLTNFPVCGNCHSFSRDGKTMGMDIDYANDKGSYFITQVSKNTDIEFNKIITWMDYKREDKEYTFGLLSQISPDGKYALSTVKDRSIFVRVNDLYYSQLFFPIKGIIGIYDIKNKQFSSLPGADNKEYCQSNPVWSPDGKTVLFARAPVYHHALAEKSNEVIIPTEYAKDFLEGKKDFKFDIYKIPFNNGQGGEALPLQGASNNGMSNFFPKFSPDGKWIVFTQAKNFMLLQPDAKLYIMPSSGGTPRIMNCNNPGAMNSWHSWSPNGKWMIYSSKAKGPYTQLFIDNDVYTLERGKEKLRIKDYPGALKELDKAIALNPKDLSSINMRGLVKFELGKHQEALEDFNKVVEIDPNSFSAYHNRANAKILMKDYEGAITDLDMAIKMNPQSSVEYHSRGEAKFDIGDYNGAIKDFNTSLQLNPKNWQAFATRAVAKYNTCDYKGAIKDFDKTLEFNPRDSVSILKRGLSKMQVGMIESGCLDLKESLRLGYREAQEYINKFCK